MKPRTKHSTSRASEGPRPSLLGLDLLGLDLLGLGVLAAAFLTLGGLFSASAALATPDKPGDSSGGSDPTVGTLPLMGGGGSADLDQTITLRGNMDDLRNALVSAGGDGYVEVIDVGEGNAWARFYGDVRIELNAADLPNIKVCMFSGFEGGGLRYLVQTAQGFGSIRALGSGDELPIDLVRLSNAGLLDDPTYIYTLHRTGDRAVTSMEADPVTGNVVLFQDV